MAETPDAAPDKTQKKAPAKKARARNQGLGIDPESTVVLIDGSGYVFRAYYAIRRLSTSDGRSVNAVFGFTQMLLKTIKDIAPAYLAIAFDTGGPNFRHQLYPAYKANRPPPPEDLPAQLPLIHEVVDAFQITRLSLPGWEADDVLGTVARLAKEQGKKVVIVTGDKDLMQLVDDDLVLLDELRNQRAGDGAQLIGSDKVIEKFGVPPERVVDVLALSGDSSDNIPGVKGIGEKTAAELVKEFGDLESILKAAPALKQKARRERLLAEADNARMSKRLVTIDEHADVHVSLDQLVYPGPDRARLRQLLSELEFKRLLNDPVVRDEDEGQGAGPLFARPAADKADADRAPVAQAAIDRSGYEEVTTLQELRGVATALEAAERIAVQIEAERSGALVGELTGIALCWGEGRGAYIPVGHHEGAAPTQLTLDEVQDHLGPLLARTDRQIASHSAKDVITALEAAGFEPLHVTGDPMVADYLLAVEEGRHDLDALARQYLGHEPVTKESLLGKGKAEVPLASIEVDRATEYAAEHAEVAWRLEAILAPRVEQRGMGELYRDMELPLARVLSKIERAGVKVDVSKLRALGDEFEFELARLSDLAYQAAGETFNLGSPQQIAEILFDKLKLPVLKKTKTGASTDSSVLEELAPKHELPAIILEHRGLAKLKSTYVDVLPNLVHPRTGRVHTTFNQAVAATGRLSSQDPNLQNIPIRTHIGRRIREAFVADVGNVIASLDYSQIELRILAHVTKDPVLIDTFVRDEDVHARTASEVFDTPLGNVTREQRTAAKSINFGLLYGMGVLRLARELGISRKEAKAYLDKYFVRFQGVREWQHEALESARETGEVRTLFGRRRLLPQLSSENRGEVARAERLATNTPIQGSAADLIKRAMIVADRELAEKVPSARMILQVHDELVLEVPEGDAARACEVVKAAMEGAAELLVPLKVDAAWARSWADAH